ncbi:hypothetical protein CEXT_214981 [Caerostris extrusa]|uniref:Uncharacterized protein n=1 Tax=Caerostris extrusa TaxID=172846 RepID=A0AAV4M482_CAEEX|nr:hypothetical protein CEXT_214981 [Caerostris extrusa]
MFFIRYLQRNEYKSPRSENKRRKCYTRLLKSERTKESFLKSEEVKSHIGQAHITEESRRTKTGVFARGGKCSKWNSDDWRVLAIPATLLLLKRKKKKRS